MAVHVQVAFNAADRGLLGDEIGAGKFQQGLPGFQFLPEMVQHFFQFVGTDGPHLFQTFHKTAHVSPPLFLGQIHRQGHFRHRVLGSLFPVRQDDGPPEVPDSHVFQGNVTQILLRLDIFQHDSPRYTMPLVLVSHTWTSYRV